MNENWIKKASISVKMYNCPDSIQPDASSSEKMRVRPAFGMRPQHVDCNIYSSLYNTALRVCKLSLVVF